MCEKRETSCLPLALGFWLPTLEVPQGTWKQEHETPLPRRALPDCVYCLGFLLWVWANAESFL